MKILFWIPVVGFFFEMYNAWRGMHYLSELNCPVRFVGSAVYHGISMIVLPILLIMLFNK